MKPKRRASWPLLAVNRNELAMASFSIAFTTEKAMNIIYAACNENCPDGEAHLVVQELYMRYRPLDTVSKVEMCQHLSHVKMKKGMNPSELFETLTSKQNQFLGPGKRLPKYEIIAIILDVASEEYRPILAVERRLKGEDLTVEDMEKAMCEEYRQLNHAYTKKIESDSEVLLFTGVCYNCGKSGHRANDCKKKTDYQGTKKAKFLGKCNNCGLHGHTGKDCWEKEENKNKRPAGWKKKSERGLTINDTTETRIEYGWTSRDKFQVEDPSTWISDTGATVHSTSHLELLSDNRSPEEDIPVIMGNGNKEKVTTIGTVKGNAINKNTKLQGSIDLSGVMYLKN
jgi:hypothetical protein